MLRISLKQLLRTPFRCVLFVVLLLGSAMLFTMGFSLWQTTSVTLDEMEKKFTTICTVEQEKSGLRIDKTWDANLNAYKEKKVPVYEELIPVSILDFKGADYVSLPEQRCFFGAYNPDLKINEVGGFKADETMMYVVEFSPIEDCIPDGPVPVQIVKNLGCSLITEGGTVYFCDHKNPTPQKMYAGHHYIARVYYSIHHTENENNEFVPEQSMTSTQFGVDGTLLETNFKSETYYDEITEGFWNTEKGKRWKEYIDAFERFWSTFPVQPVNNLNTLQPFYNGSAVISEGRAFTEEEQDTGANVCLVPSNFARWNELKVGDSLQLPLYFASFGWTAKDIFEYGMAAEEYFGLLNTEGKAYPVFEDSEYKIIGIYDGGYSEGDFSLGDCEVIIPSASVTGDYSQNIVDYGPMRAVNTSFQIPNGTIAAYQEACEKAGIRGLDFSFYDKGYTNLRKDLDNMRQMAGVLLIVGCISSILILMFFSYLFIAKQKKRTAIERSMGLSNTQCAASLLTGMVLLILLGTILGCTGGLGAAERVSVNMESMEKFDVTYTKGSSGTEEGASLKTILVSTHKVQSAVFSGIMILTVSVMISFAYVQKNLHEEPLELLQRYDE